MGGFILFRYFLSLFLSINIYIYAIKSIFNYYYYDNIYFISILRNIYNIYFCEVIFKYKNGKRVNLQLLNNFFVPNTGLLIISIKYAQNRYYI